MKFFLVFISLICLVLAETTSTLKTTTWVWATGTDSAGVTKTTESAYTQKFTSFYSEVATPASGDIGLGSISGEVGEIRTYAVETVSAANGATSSHSIISPIKGFSTTTSFLIISAFLSAFCICLV